MKYSMIVDTALKSGFISNEQVKELFEKNLFCDKEQFNCYKDVKTIGDISSTISSSLKKRMSQLSIGICAALECGIKPHLTTEEIYLFTAFAEIETTNKIIKSIKIDDSLLVSPTLFHNSVHNTPLGYFTIINKINNYCATISDGLDTNKSFLDFISLRCKMQDPFVITSGEEFSEFYSLDNTKNIDIIPTFIAYKIIPESDKGFSEWREYDTIKDIDVSGYDYIFADRETFLELDSKVDALYTDYPITLDNPCAVIFRLALPFIIGLQGRGLIIERCRDKSYCAEVML